MSTSTGRTPTFAACLEIGPRVAVIPASEMWPDGTLRPALEDWLGAGAVIEHLRGSLSPEACAARDSYRAARSQLPGTLRACCSGNELVTRGYEQDVSLASELLVSGCVPKLRERAYVALGTP